MSYTPTNWQKGDIITHTRLNNIEQGIVSIHNKGASVLIVDEIFEQPGNPYLNATLGTIMNAVRNGTTIIVNHANLYQDQDFGSWYQMINTYSNLEYLDNPNETKYLQIDGYFTYEAQDLSDYPILNSF